MSRRRGVVFVTLLALVGIGIRIGLSDAARWIWVERVYIRTRLGGDLDPEVLGWREFSRWGDRLELSYQVWSVDSGMQRLQGIGDYSTKALTAWDEDGRLYYQVEGSRWQYSAPWKWGMTDRTEPDAPWIREGITPEKWWDRLPDDAKAE